MLTVLFHKIPVDIQPILAATLRVKLNAGDVSTLEGGTEGVAAILGGGDADPGILGYHNEGMEKVHIRTLPKAVENAVLPHFLGRFSSGRHLEGTPADVGDLELRVFPWSQPINPTWDQI
jgi:hypothetical protein